LLSLASSQNHLDAIPFDDNDRRTIVVANPRCRRAPYYQETAWSMTRTSGSSVMGLDIRSTRRHVDELNEKQASTSRSSTSALHF
jgi:hypothetical protein